MTTRKLPFGTTALVGAGVAGAAAISGAAEAAQVLPGGALDVTVSGFIGFRAHGGDLDNQFNDPAVSTGLDFSNNTEVHVILRGRQEALGLDYGGTVEFEADTNRSDNTDETWVFARGGFGEFRFGDEDGPVEASSIGAYTIAAGTGGIDGDIVEELSVTAVRPASSSDATKIRYYTPSFGGFQVGVSYTPNTDSGDALAPKDVQAGDLVEGALVYDGELAGLDIRASLVGSVGEVKDEDDLGRGDFWTYYAGAAADVFGLMVAGGFGDEEVGGLERTYFNVGLGAGLGPIHVSANYGQVLASEGYEGDEPYNAVLSADAAILPGLVLAGDVAYFDNDIDAGDRATDGDHGWVYVTRLSVAF